MTSFEQLDMHSPNLVDTNWEVSQFVSKLCDWGSRWTWQVKKAIDFDLLRQELSHVVEGDSAKLFFDALNAQNAAQGEAVRYGLIASLAELKQLLQ